MSRTGQATTVIVGMIALLVVVGGACGIARRQSLARRHAEFHRDCESRARLLADGPEKLKCGNINGLPCDQQDDPCRAFGTLGRPITREDHLADARFHQFLATEYEEGRR